MVTGRRLRGGGSLDLRRHKQRGRAVGRRVIHPSTPPYEALHDEAVALVNSTTAGLPWKQARCRHVRPPLSAWVTSAPPGSSHSVRRTSTCPWLLANQAAVRPRPSALARCVCRYPQCRDPST
jgi:hypothetical protein